MARNCGHRLPIDIEPIEEFIAHAAESGPMEP
jgi:hypothetical protein